MINFMTFLHLKIKEVLHLALEQSMILLKNIKIKLKPFIMFQKILTLKNQMLLLLLLVYQEAFMIRYTVNQIKC